MARVKLKKAEIRDKGVKPKNITPDEFNLNHAAPRPQTIVAAADRLHSAAIHLLRRVRQQDSATSVGPAQLSALSVLVFAGAKTLGELAAAEQVKPPTMSRIVASLKRSHLIEIAHDAHDARRLHVRASRQGRRLLQQARRRRIQSLAGHLSLLAAEEFGTLCKAVEILKDLLERWH